MTEKTLKINHKTVKHEYIMLDYQINQITKHSENIKCV